MSQDCVQGWDGWKEERSDSELSDGQFDEVHFIEQRQGIFSFWQSPQKIKLRFRYADDAALMCRTPSATRFEVVAQDEGALQS